MDAKPIMLWSRPTETPRSLPANISLKGLTVQLEKDTFTPGEQIKIDLAADNIEMLQLRLTHDANVICKCPNFANICTYMHESPSKTIASANLEGVRKESRYTLKIPETAEESYFFTWQPSEQTGWYHSLESNSKYYLEIEGHNVFNEKVQVTIPIQISRPPEEKWEEPLLVHPEHGALPLSRLAMKPKKLMDIMGHEIEGTSLILRARNVADRTLEGVTVKVAGLVEEFFERFPRMIGIASWDQNEEKSLTYEKYSNEITEYQITIEDNKDAITTTKYSL